MIYDISPLITSDLAVFPGDTSFQRSISMDIEKGDHLSLSSITTTLHLGAHVDAPSHYHKSGVSIEHCSLAHYLGPCQVLDVSDHNGELTTENIKTFDIQTERILFKTNSIKDENKWQTEFSYLAPDLISNLAKKGVRLIGIDTPSVDYSKSKDLKAHHSFFHNDILILEGLKLEKIKMGLYFLIALPLKIKGADASPVRAVLLDRNYFKLP